MPIAVAAPEPEDTLTPAARRVLYLAEATARERGAREWDTGDLLVGVLAEGSLSITLVTEAGERRLRAEELQARLNPARNRPPSGTQARASVAEAWRQAGRLGHRRLRPDHLLLGLLMQPDSAAERLLAACGASAAELLAHLLSQLP